MRSRSEQRFLAEELERAEAVASDLRHPLAVRQRARLRAEQFRRALDATSSPHRQQIGHREWSPNK